MSAAGDVCSPWSLCAKKLSDITLEGCMQEQLARNFFEDGLQTQIFSLPCCCLIYVSPEAHSVFCVCATSAWPKDSYLCGLEMGDKPVHFPLSGN